jgi:hypothetical protein
MPMSFIMIPVFLSLKGECGSIKVRQEGYPVRIAPGCRETLRQIGDNEYYAFLT